MINPAIIPPKIGAAQYNQWNSQNPEINAGPNVLAGFTDAPVSGTATRCIKKIIPPITNPCNPGDAFL